MVYQRVERQVGGRQRRGWYRRVDVDWLALGIFSLGMALEAPCLSMFPKFIWSFYTHMLADAAKHCLKE